MPPENVGELPSPHSSCSDVNEQASSEPSLPHDMEIMLGDDVSQCTEEPEREKAAKEMPPETDGEEQQEPAPETARGRGSSSSRPADPNVLFEDSFPELPGKGGSISEVQQERVWQRPSSTLEEGRGEACPPSCARQGSGQPCPKRLTCRA